MSYVDQFGDFMSEDFLTWIQAMIWEKNMHDKLIIKLLQSKQEKKTARKQIYRNRWTDDASTNVRTTLMKRNKFIFIALYWWLHF